MVAERCGDRGAHFARRLSYFNWAVNCERRRMGAFSELSRLALLDHQPASAHAFADSAVAIDRTNGGCFDRASHRALADARLAEGDTAGAARSFATSFWFDDGKASTRAERDSIRRVVAPAVDSAHFSALMAAAVEEGRACARRARDARKSPEPG
jgi:hypothetical protein